MKCRLFVLLAPLMFLMGCDECSKGSGKCSSLDNHDQSNVRSDITVLKPSAEWKGVSSITNVKELDDMLAEYQHVVLKVYADWCPPCRRLAPVYEAVAENLSSTKDLLFIKANIDLSSELVQKYGVQKVPTLLFFNNGKLVNRTVGFKDQELLISLVNEACAIDK